MRKTPHLFIPASGAGNALRTKIGLALIGALLVGGGGTTMATTHV